MHGLPAVWQQLIDAAGLVRGQPRKNILEVGVGIVPAHTCRLDQAHHRRCPLARAQATGKQPVAPANRDRADLVLDPVVVHRQLSVIDEPRERLPAPQAVVQRLGRGRGRSIRRILALQPHPLPVRNAIAVNRH